ncbi:MAG: S1/P1 Nuclease [Bacteroidia bacterium]
MPEHLFELYRPFASEIEEWATKADQRRYIVPQEGAKHYIDIDYYEASSPLDTIIKPWHQLLVLQSLDTTYKHGILPWSIQEVYHRLRESFAMKDTNAIIKLSADLGHYVADAHVPLHTTSNYNGQLSNQHGIHGLWETRLPSLYMDSYELIIPPARYIASIDSCVWKTIEESFAAKDSVLGFEKQLAEKEVRFGYENKGGRTVKVYSKHYCELYNSSLNNMVERRYKKAIHTVASLWFSAWLDAQTVEQLENPKKSLDSLLIDYKSSRDRILIH